MLSKRVFGRLGALALAMTLAGAVGVPANAAPQKPADYCIADSGLNSIEIRVFSDAPCFNVDILQGHEDLNGPFSGNFWHFEYWRTSPYWHANGASDTWTSTLYDESVRPHLPWSGGQQWCTRFWKQTGPTSYQQLGPITCTTT